MPFLEKVFGSYSGRELKKITPILNKVLALEEEYSAFTDEQLKAKTPEFKQRYEKGESLDDLLPEAFATVREAAWRVLEMKPFPVQVIGGIVLHQGRIAEMKTGEGKTLVATLPTYLNALTGKGVHIVTVNDYLAKRDSEWMGKVHNFLGLSVGVLVHGLSDDERRTSYNCDITYCTNNELGFDYLRDNMAVFAEQRVQRGHAFAIVDEVDSILIDEARTPLIISGPGDKANENYAAVDKFVRTLTKVVIREQDDKQIDDFPDADFVVNEKDKQATLTTRGIEKAERYFKINEYTDPENMELVHHIKQALHAHGIMKRDGNYIVKDGEVLIVDEFTGRIMPGRRYSEGLHQAIEAKEHVKIERESKTFATITFQNFFRLYKKLSGMTGTAQTEEVEFQEIYNLDVIVIPTNKDLIRNDLPDVLYKNVASKYRAIIQKIKECHEIGQPVLVGTVSVEKSEELSNLLKKEGIKHEVLNAKNHEREAEIVAQAGKYGSVTIATNMAGRGTDIILGGNAEYMAKHDLHIKGYDESQISNATSYFETDDEEILALRKEFADNLAKHKAELKEETEKVLASGGLCIIGTERHDSRRIDNQLRGRSGRQGDVGITQFYISLEDDLIRIFGGDRMYNIANSLGMKEDQPIEQKMMSRTIENAQQRVESMNFGSRKNVLKYDDILNLQREIVYKERNKVLDGESVDDIIKTYFSQTADSILDKVLGDSVSSENYDWDFLTQSCRYSFATDVQLDDETKKSVTDEKLDELIQQVANGVVENKRKEFNEKFEEFERVILLRVVDARWQDHIDEMEQLRQMIGMRAHYQQKDPFVEYRLEGMSMFDDMIDEIKKETVHYIAHSKPAESVVRRVAPVKVKAEFAKDTESDDNAKPSDTPKTVVNTEKVGRNAPCPCGSGKKYKKCCGA